MTTHLGWMIEPFRYHLMQSAFAAVVMVGITCAVLGCFVVLRRMAFIGDAIAHTALPGVAIAYLKGFNLFFGALIAGLLTALGIGLLSRRQELREDTAIGVMYTGMFALGVMIISRARSFREFSTMLFGDVLGVTTTDLCLIGVILLIVLGVTVALFKELELTSFDPSYAAVIGIRIGRMRNVLLILLALAIVAGIQAVGVLMVVALLITPAAAASLVSGSLFRMMIAASIVAIVAGVVGLYVSFFGNSIAAGAAIVLACTGIFAIVFLVRQLVDYRRNAS